MIELKIKKSFIEPLFFYEPRLNHWHEKEHQITYDNACGFLQNILEPLLKKIKEMKEKSRTENRYHFADEFTVKCENSCKFLKKVFTACKQTQTRNNVENIVLSFMD